jgi:hypothetical protein
MAAAPLPEVMPLIAGGAPGRSHHARRRVGSRRRRRISSQRSSSSSGAGARPWDGSPAWQSALRVPAIRRPSVSSAERPPLRAGRGGRVLSHWDSTGGRAVLTARLRGLPAPPKVGWN